MILQLFTSQQSKQANELGVFLDIRDVRRRHSAGRNPGARPLAPQL
jgi:hypothetical protein